MTDPILTTFLIAFAPGLVALARGHRSMLAIIVLNAIALGLIASVVLSAFGFLLDLIALIWAMTSNTNSNRRRDLVYVTHAVQDALAHERDATNRAQWIKEHGEDTAVPTGRFAIIREIIRK